MKTVFCTLFEGHYHYGIAALANSLAASGYEGELWVGYRGELADWIAHNAGYDRATQRLRVNDGFSLCFVPLSTPVFFTYYKPTFMRSVLKELAPQADAVAYIDPDIVVNCPWDGLSIWFEGGIALCEDVNNILPARHPKRMLWNAWFAQRGYEPCRPLERYYNAGFIGVPRSHSAFLDLWIDLCALVLEYNSGLQHIKAGGAQALFHSTDQDAMNFALTVQDVPLNTAGPEAMDFAPGGYFFSHAIGFKPWQGQHVRRALRGIPPSMATRAYYEHANAPLSVFTPRQYRLRRLSLSVASAIGRFYRKF